MKEGDNVKCIDPDMHGELEIGNVYRVSYVEPHTQTPLKVVGVPGWWSKSRFVLDNPEEVQVKDGNPKEAIASTKVDMSVVPATLEIAAALAFTEGALKYGAFNWRVKGVRVSTYYAALQRHLKKWFNGEECDQATGVPHLANAVACIAIILDAAACNKLTDDRPPKVDIAKLLLDYEPIIAGLRKQREGLPAPHHCTALEPACPSPAG